jgi:pyrroline-5-carboxylate reductase
VTSDEAFWIVGCGNMAGAMVQGWRKAGVLGNSVLAIRPSGRQVEGVETVTSIPPEGEPPLLMLGFKPQKIDEIAPGLEPHIGPDTVLVSILAGVELASLRARFPRAATIIRAMPNLPVSEGRGVTALIGEQAIDPATRKMFEALGIAQLCDSEADFSAIGALAGSGPAYVARFTTALALAGEAQGLAPDVARRLALETVLGTALMADRIGEPMDALATRVASPNGTTEAGLSVLDRGNALNDLLDRTLQAAIDRGIQLASAARG